MSKNSSDSHHSHTNRFLSLLKNVFRVAKFNKTAHCSFLSYVDQKSEIKNNSKVYSFCKITNSIIGSYTYLSYGANINNTRVGRFCSIASGVKMGLGKHPISYVSTSPVFYSINNALGYSFAEENTYAEYDPISIGNDVWIGTDVLILDGVKVGDGAIVAAKSLVNKDVPPYAIVGGVPAKILKYRFDTKTIDALLNIKWWDYPIEKLELLASNFNNIHTFVNSISHPPSCSEIVD